MGGGVLVSYVCCCVGIEIVDLRFCCWLSSLYDLGVSVLLFEVVVGDGVLVLSFLRVLLCWY